MSKRFGRNQKRKLKEELADARRESYQRLTALEHARTRISKLRRQLHYLEERPMLMRVHSGEPERREAMDTFCLEISRPKMEDMRMDSRQLYSFIANELSGAVMSNGRLRSFITPHRHPTTDMHKIMEM